MKRTILLLLALPIFGSLSFAQALNTDFIVFPPGKFRCTDTHHRAISVENHTVSLKTDADSLVKNYFFPKETAGIAFKAIPRDTIVNALSPILNDCNIYAVTLDDPTHSDITHANNNDYIKFKVVSGILNNSRIGHSQKLKERNLILLDVNKNFFSVALFQGLLEKYPQADTFYFSHAQRIYRQGSDLIISAPSILVRIKGMDGTDAYFDYSQEPPTK